METNEELLAGYSDREKGAYLGAIACLATADREATTEEEEFLSALAEGANLSPEQQRAVLEAAHDPSNVNLRQCLDTLRNSDLRFSLISDVIAFAKIDGHYSTEEEEKIKQMASYLNIDASQFSTLNQFVNQAEQAQQQGQDLTSPNFFQSSGLGDSFRRSGINSNAVMKGMLGILAPIVLSRMLSRGGRRSGMGGLLGGLLGGAMMGGGGMSGGGMFGGRSRGMGGLGSIFDMLSGGRGYRGGGMGGLLGGLFGSRRGGGFGF